MKKVFVALGIILVIAGIVIVGVYGGAKGFSDWKDYRFHDVTTASNGLEFSAEELRGLQKIEVEADNFCVYVVESANAHKVSVKYVSDLPKGVQIAATQEGNVLKVTQTMDNDVNLMEKFWNGEYFKYFVVIELPKTEEFSKVEITGKIRHGHLFVDTDIFE